MLRLPAKRKYKNKPTEKHGQRFDSGWEAAYYQELLLRMAAGEVRSLLMQVSFPLKVNEVVVSRYVADFVYEEAVRWTADGKRMPQPDWVTRIVDTKSEPTRATRMYQLKKRWMKALGLEIVEVMKPQRRQSRWQALPAHLKARVKVPE